MLQIVGERRVRVTYAGGAMEVSRRSQRHEQAAQLLGLFITRLAEELEIPYEPLGMTTWKLPGAEKGLEADQCYYMTMGAGAAGVGAQRITASPGRAGGHCPAGPREKAAAERSSQVVREAERRMQNRFLTDAIERVLREIERRRVDAAFARIAEDLEYQAELLRMEQELSPLSDAAWQLLDIQHPGDP